MEQHPEKNQIKSEAFHDGWPVLIFQSTFKVIGLLFVRVRRGFNNPREQAGPKDNHGQMFAAGLLAESSMCAEAGHVARTFLRDPSASGRTKKLAEQIFSRNKDATRSKAHRY